MRDFFWDDDVWSSTVSSCGDAVVQPDHEA
jgi:hypothetical protein